MNYDLAAHTQATFEALTAELNSMQQLHDSAVATIARVKPTIRVLQRAVDELQRQLDECELRTSEPSGSGCTNKEEVLHLIRQVLEENSQVPRDDLKALVGDRLRQLGRNHKMFSNIFTKCLKDKAFTQHESGEYRLTTTGEVTN